MVKRAQDTLPLLQPYLHPGLGQVDLHRQLLPREHVRVVGLGENSLQSLQLHIGKKTEGRLLIIKMICQLIWI